MTTQLRENVAAAFEKIIGNEGNVARNLEIHIYNWAIAYAKDHNITRTWSNGHFRSCYTHKAMNILSNLDSASYVGNDHLIVRLKAGTVTIDTISKMTPQEMYPEIWKPHIQALKLKEEKALKPELLPTTTRFTCSRCKQKDCVYHVMQIRSGDEGSTIFVRCNKCQHSWRINS